MDLRERASRYLAAMDPSVSGSNGHNAAFAAASALVHGFGFDEAGALELLRSEFNPRCSPPWSERELVHKVRSAMGNPPADKPRGYLAGSSKAGFAGGAVARPAVSGPVARAPEKKRLDFEERELAKVNGWLDLGDMREFLWLRSPMSVDVGPVDALSALYDAGEKVLVFRTEFSQGHWGIEVKQRGHGVLWALGDRPGVRPERCEKLPEGGKSGMWFLNQPVDGKWRPNGQVDEDGQAKLSRRSTANVTAWRYMVLESDEADAGAWLRLMVTLPLPVAALYESGGRSVHALVRVDARSLPEWNMLRDRLSPFLTRLGADGGALSAVRLTRVPNVLRFGSGMRDEYVRFDRPRMQSLLWLDPFARCERIEGRPVVRRR